MVLPGPNLISPPSYISPWTRRSARTPLLLRGRPRLSFRRQCKHEATIHASALGTIQVARDGHMVGRGRRNPARGGGRQGNRARAWNEPGEHFSVLRVKRALGGIRLSRGLKSGSTHTPPPLHMDGGSLSFCVSRCERRGRLRDAINCGYRRLDTGLWAWRCLVLDLGEIPWVCAGIGFIEALFPPPPGFLCLRSRTSSA